MELRPLTGLEDTDRIIEVMTATWGGQEITREIFRAFQESGNVPHGAFVGDEMVGYVLGWVGVGPEGFHVHSHMLAVLGPWRARGVGYALKLAQRAAALDAGVHVVRWTFDPLVSRNAYFNFRKLGTVADRFERNFYGEMGDMLNRGDRSDRLVVRWELDRPPGPRSLPAGEERALVAAEDQSDAPRPVRVAEAPGASPGVRWTIAIPPDQPNLRASAPDRAAAWRDAVADALEACFGVGMVALGFRAPSEGGGVPGYVMALPEEGA